MGGNEMHFFRVHQPFGSSLEDTENDERAIEVRIHGGVFGFLQDS